VYIYSLYTFFIIIVDFFVTFDRLSYLKYLFKYNIINCVLPLFSNKTDHNNNNQVFYSQVS
jgi:hypothetical protein